MKGVVPSEPYLTSSCPDLFWFICTYIFFFKVLLILFIYYYFFVSALPPFIGMMHHVHAVPKKASREHWIPWNGSYIWLGAVRWVLGIELPSYRRTASALND